MGKCALRLTKIHVSRGGVGLLRWSCKSGPIGFFFPCVTPWHYMLCNGGGYGSRVLYIRVSRFSYVELFSGRLCVESFVVLPNGEGRDRRGRTWHAGRCLPVLASCKRPRIWALLRYTLFNMSWSFILIQWFKLFRISYTTHDSMR